MNCLSTKVACVCAREQCKHETVSVSTTSVKTCGQAHMVKLGVVTYLKQTSETTTRTSTTTPGTPRNLAGCARIMSLRDQPLQPSACPSASVPTRKHLDTWSRLGTPRREEVCRRGRRERKTATIDSTAQTEVTFGEDITVTPKRCKRRRTIAEERPSDKMVRKLDLAM